MFGSWRNRYFTYVTELIFNHVSMLASIKGSEREDSRSFPSCIILRCNTIIRRISGNTQDVDDEMKGEDKATKRVTKGPIAGHWQVRYQECEEGEKEVEEEEPCHELKWMQRKCPSISPNSSCRSRYRCFCFLTCHFSNFVSRLFTPIRFSFGSSVFFLLISSVFFSIFSVFFISSVFFDIFLIYSETLRIKILLLWLENLCVLLLYVDKFVFKVKLFVSLSCVRRLEAEERKLEAEERKLEAEGRKEEWTFQVIHGHTSLMIELCWSWWQSPLDSSSWREAALPWLITSCVRSFSMRGTRRESEGEKEKHLWELEEWTVKEQDLFGTFLLLPLLLPLLLDCWVGNETASFARSSNGSSITLLREWEYGQNERDAGMCGMCTFPGLLWFWSETYLPASSFTRVSKILAQLRKRDSTRDLNLWEGRKERKTIDLSHREENREKEMREIHRKTTEEKKSKDQRTVSFSQLLYFEHKNKDTKGFSQHALLFHF